MRKVILGMSLSMDGIAGGRREEEFWPVHESVLGWVFNLRSWRSAQGMDGGEDTTNSRIWAEDYARLGAQVVGRTMFDFGYEPWGDNPPFHMPVFVHTTRAGEPVEKLGGTTYTFVTEGIEAVVNQARAAAGDKDVLLAGGVSLAQQALRAGVVDELSVHIAPVLIGFGVRLFDSVAETRTRLRPTRAVESDGIVHLSYDVVR